MEKDLNKLFQQSKLQNQQEDSLVTKYDMGNGFFYHSTISRILVSTITIPRGHKAVDNQSVEWQVSIDKSNVELVVNYIQNPTTNVEPGTEPGGVYEIHLVGTLIYNVILLEFDTVTDSDGLPNRGVFSYSGEVVLNENLGFVTTYEEVLELTMQGIQIVVVDENVTVSSATDSGIGNNPTDERTFEERLDGREEMMFQLQRMILIALGDVAPEGNIIS